MATPATPQPQTLAQSVRAKYPGAYDDMSDVDLEQKIVAKYPQYADMPRTPRMPTPDAQISAAPTGVLPWLNSAENDLRYGTDTTALGKFLSFLGAKGINRGVSEGAANSAITGPVRGPLEVAQGVANMGQHPIRGTFAATGGLLDTAGPFLGMGAPEIAEGASVIPGAVKTVAKGTAEAASDANNVLARMLRYPATARQSQLGRPGTIKNMLPSFLQKYTVPEGIIPKGDLGTVTNPGPYAEIPVKVKPSVPTAPVDNAANISKKTLDQAYTGERPGMPYQPNPRYVAAKPTAAPIPQRSGLALPPGPPEAAQVNKSLLNGAWTGERTGLPYKPNPRYAPPIAPAAPIPARTGLMLPSAPAEVTQAAKPAVSMFPRPLRPLVGTPEEFAAYDQQMKLLKGEASDAGTYSAARGKVGKKLNYQQRIGQKVNP